MSAAPHAIDSSDERAAPSFVGRERELAELRAGLDDARAGRGRLFLLVGEPGIGKTRLAAEIAAEADQRGTAVLWGRCSEDIGVPPFWPWAQMLRRLRVTDDSTGGRQLLAQIVPELRVDGEAAVVSSQPNEQRFALFDAVERTLRAAALRQPLLLIFDDLHAADLPSLLLLRFLAYQVHDSRLMVIGSYRAPDLDRVAERAQVLNPISRHGTRLPLTALSEAHVGNLVSVAFGDAVPATLAASVYALTEGNPLFVGEVMQLLVAERDTTGVLPSDARTVRLPHGVREVIRERLQPLSIRCRDLLCVAAVLGREFEASRLRVLSAAPAAVQMDCLAEAERAGLVLSLDAQRGRFQWSHELIRDTLYEAISAGERAQLHHRIAAAIEAAHAGDLGSHAAEIAFHFTRSAVLGDADKAVDYAERAARQAVQQWAYEEADELYAQALHALASSPAPDRLRRCELLLAQGYTQHAAGRVAARPTYAEAAALARSLCREEPARGAELFAAAALGVADQGLGLLQMNPDATAVQLLEEAERLLPHTHTQPAVRVRARLAAHLSFSATQARSLELIEQAEQQARTLGDEPTLAMVLGQRHLVLWRFNVIPGQSERATEIVELAERLGDRELAWQGRAWRVVDRMAIGDAVGVDRDLSLLVERSETIRQPRFRWMATNFRVARALWRGQWSEAETLARESWDLGVELADPMAQAAAPFQLYLVARELGREPDEAMARAAVQRFPDSPMVRAILVMTLLDLDRRSEAQAQFDQLAVGEFAAVSRDSRVGALALLAEACWRLGDVARARVLMDRLLPFAEYNIMYAGNTCFGAAARYLGELATACEDWEAAAAYFETAIARNRCMGAYAPLAWTQHDAACMWLRRAPTSPAPATCIEHARRLLAEARSGAAGLSMVRLQHTLDELASRISATETNATAKLAPAQGEGVVRLGTFHRDGEYWSISDGRELVRVKDTRGLHYIASLLRQPGAAVHALDLASGGARDGLAPATDWHERPAAGAEPLLDARSRAAYRKRLAELRAEIDEAQQFHDLGRLAGLQGEQDQLEHELSRAVGLRGRNRPSGSAVERARLNVTRAIKTAVRKLSADNAALGHYFATTIKTGNLCSYTPEPRSAIKWVL